MPGKKTSRRVAKEAGKELKSKTSTPAEQSVAGSDLVQAGAKKAAPPKVTKPAKKATAKKGKSAK